MCVVRNYLHRTPTRFALFGNQTARGGLELPPSPLLSTSLAVGAARPPGPPGSLQPFSEDASPARAQLRPGDRGFLEGSLLLLTDSSGLYSSSNCQLQNVYPQPPSWQGMAFFQLDFCLVLPY